MPCQSSEDGVYFATQEDVAQLLEALEKDYNLVGPVKEGGQTIFREVSAGDALDWDYTTTQLSPVKFVYKYSEVLFTREKSTPDIEATMDDGGKQVLIGVHPCDVHALLYLDKVFLDAYSDVRYRQRREDTILIALNCTKASAACFCASMKTGPFLQGDGGYDLLFTKLNGGFLVETRSERGRGVLTGVGMELTSHAQMEEKKELEGAALQSFVKSLDLEGLQSLLRRNLNHPTWDRTGETLCLTCTNCTMVCPTCYCYDVVDTTDFRSGKVTRHRQKDSCYELHFAEVHGGNFRSTRGRRLRQFVLHKLDYVEQYGQPGCIGCGRCITWCPTGIDLTEIAKEIQRGER